MHATMDKCTEYVIIVIITGESMEELKYFKELKTSKYGKKRMHIDVPEGVL